jgi:hypothetical protein
MSQDSKNNSPLYFTVGAGVLCEVTLACETRLAVFELTCVEFLACRGQEMGIKEIWPMIERIMRAHAAGITGWSHEVSMDHQCGFACGL